MKIMLIRIMQKTYKFNFKKYLTSKWRALSLTKISSQIYKSAKITVKACSVIIINCMQIISLPPFFLFFFIMTKKSIYHIFVQPT